MFWTRCLEAARVQSQPGALKMEMMHCRARQHVARMRRTVTQGRVNMPMRPVIEDDFGETATFYRTKRVVSHAIAV